MGTTKGSITNRVQEIEERISGVEDTIEEIDSLSTENIKFPNIKKDLPMKGQEAYNTPNRLDQKKKKFSPQS